MNKFIGIGNLTETPETKESKDTKITNFTVAINEGKSTIFLPVTTFGNLADNCKLYLVKGSKVAVIGRLDNYSYEDKNGNKKTITSLIADTVEFLTPKTQTQN